MDVIPLDANLVKGSHGHITDSVEQSPLFMTKQSDLLRKQKVAAIEVFDLILSHLMS